MPLVSVQDLILPAGVTLLRWDATVQEYADVADDYSPAPGDAFWIENANDSTQRVYLTGFVIMDATRTIQLLPALNVLGHPFTSAGNDMELGRGYWFANRSSNTIAWAMQRPYGTEGITLSLPLLASLTADGSHATLEILPGGGCEVLAQDLEPTTTLDLDENWRVLASLPGASGTESILWTDAIPETVYARIYQVRPVSRAGGLPDNESGTSLDEDLVAATNHTAETTETMDQAQFGDDSDRSTGEEGALLTATNQNDQQIITLPSKLIYVDARLGDDRLSGRAGFRAGLHGPKQSIRAGLGQATPGDMVVIGDGAYGEDLNVAGRDVDVRIAGNVDLTRKPVTQPATPHVNPPSTNGPALSERN